MSLPKFKPCLTDQNAISELPKRFAPYWYTLEYCRHVGIQKHPTKDEYWVARVRLREGGRYRQRRLAKVDFANKNGVDFRQAVVLARRWFQQPDNLELAAEPYPVGANRELKYTKSSHGFTVGDALKDYVDWKRVAAAKTTFEANLSLINHHIIPRLADLQVSDLSARRLTKFMVDVLETPPKHGRQTPRFRVKLSDLSSDQLRKRKKTVNTLLGILKLALQMAWENGEYSEERIWRTIRRLPHKDAPRNLFLNREQCRQLLEHCEEHLRLVVLGALYTGCRITELSKLDVADVEPGIRGLYVSPSKSSQGRYVFLPREGLSFFKKQCRGKKQDEAVFSMKSGRRWNGNHKHLFKNAVRAAGLPDKFVFHGLRHTYASQLVQSGTPLAIVARQLGHANTDTVSRTYGHLSCESIETELERRFTSISGAGRSKSLSEDTPVFRPNDRAKTITQTSWPNANYSKASGDLVAALRGR